MKKYADLKTAVKEIGCAIAEGIDNVRGKKVSWSEKILKAISSSTEGQEMVLSGGTQLWHTKAEARPSGDFEGDSKDNGDGTATLTFKIFGAAKKSPASDGYRQDITFVEIKVKMPNPVQVPVAKVEVKPVQIPVTTKVEMKAAGPEQKPNHYMEIMGRKIQSLANRFSNKRC